jgi:hypothetical protein
MMRLFGWLMLMFLSVLVLTSTAMATVATIETAAPLSDHSEPALKAAVTQVVQSVARGALAMGLSWVQISQVRVLEDSVTIRALATDVKPEDETDSDQDDQGDGAEDGAPQPTPEPGPSMGSGSAAWHDPLYLPLAAMMALSPVSQND